MSPFRKTHWDIDDRHVVEAALAFQCVQLPPGASAALASMAGMNAGRAGTLTKEER